MADFQWVPSDPPDPFAMASVSDNGVGGTLQLWRINDMIWRPEDEVLAEMEEHRCFPRTHRPPNLCTCVMPRRTRPGPCSLLCMCPGTCTLVHCKPWSPHLHLAS